MITAGIARQWVEGADVARVLHSDGESVVKKWRHSDTSAQRENLKRQYILIQMMWTLKTLQNILS